MYDSAATPVQASNTRGVTAPQRRRARWSVSTAALLALTLALTGCTPLLTGLFGGTEPEFSAPEPSADFSSYLAQTPAWAPCADQLECAEVFAPLDWHEPDGDRVTLALVRQPATGAEPPLGTLFVNPGGPGASGVSYLMGGASAAVSPAVLERYDIVGWDPRGVGASSAITCLSPAEMDEMNYGHPEISEFAEGSDEWIEEAIAGGREYGDACLENSGPLAGFVNTFSTVADLDMLRAIMGDEQLNFLGYSYGTKLGARYAQAYPDRVGRLVLDGALDPAATLSEVVFEQTKGFEQALRAYASDCVTTENCPFAGSPDDALTEIREVLAQADANPIVAEDGRVVGQNVMLTAIIAALYDRQSWPYITRMFTELSEGNTQTTLFLADFYNDREAGVYQSNMMEAFNAINCLDYPEAPPMSPDQMRANAAELRAVAPTIGEFQGFGETFCADWPVAASPRDPSPSEPTVAAGAAPILVVGTTGDPATPYQWAVDLAQQLESGVLVSYHAEGHTAYLKNECVNAVIDEYLLTGNAPSSDPHCARAE